MIPLLDESGKHESKKVIDICPEEIKLVDIDLDLSNCIVYGLSENGEIFGRSYFMKPYYSMVNFSYTGEKNWALFNKSKNKKSKNSPIPMSISLSRNCKWLVVSSSRQVEGDSENYLKVFSLSKPVKIEEKKPTNEESPKPKLVSETEFTTDWKGSKLFTLLSNLIKCRV